MSPGTLLLGWPKAWLLRPVAEFSIVYKALSNDDDHGEEEVLVTFNVESHDRSCIYLSIYLSVY